VQLFGGQYPDALEQQRGYADQMQPDAGPARLQPTLPGGLAPSHGQPVALPGFNFPPEGAYAVDAQQDANIAAGATSTIITVNVPATYTLRIDGIGFGASDDVAVRFITWNLLVDNSPAQAYQNVGAAIGSIGQVSDIVLNVPGLAIVTVQVTADASAVLTYRYICRLKGWLYLQRGA
jgi:hypothetical protein